MSLWVQRHRAGVEGASVTLSWSSPRVVCRSCGGETHRAGQGGLQVNAVGALTQPMSHWDVALRHSFADARKGATGL